MATRRPTHRRRGFTLIEMLVALTLLIVLATLSIAIIPKVQERTKAGRGGDLLQGWLLGGKQLALRDRVPKGVRLISEVDPTTGQYTGFVKTLQYIEQPDKIAANPTNGFTAIYNPTTNSVSFPGQDLGGTGSLQLTWPVMPGDYIQFYDGPSYKIAAAPPMTYSATTGTTVYLTYQEVTAQNLPPTPITNYTITRQPRPIAGEAQLQMPDDVAIDLGKSLAGANALSNPTVLPYYDILFTPSGTLTGALGDTTGKIILWVRDITQDPDQPGQQPLIVVFSRTGRIGGFPSDPTGANPYIYVFDPRNTGL